jgi:DnaJ-domain-containing protein 1
MRYIAEAVHTRAGPYPFRWHQKGRTHLLQARLELAAGKFERALAGARELMVESTRSGDAVSALAARLLEAEVMAASGAAIDVKAVGEALKRAADLMGGESWRVAVRLAKLTQNAGWAALAERQLEHLIESSGSHAGKVREFADSYRERNFRPDPGVA